MSKERNFLLGYGERLVSPISPNSGPQNKKAPYSVDEARQRLIPMFAHVSEVFDAIPSKACPNDYVVGVVTLHPEYLAKSYFPGKLFNKAEMQSIGSRPSLIKPEKWTRKKPVSEVVSTEVFVAGKRSAFRNWAQSIKNDSFDDNVSNEFTRIEKIKPFIAKEKLKLVGSKTNADVYEVALHNFGSSNFVENKFLEFLKDYNLNFDKERVLHAGGISFLPLRADRDQIKEVAQYTPLRVIRPMPGLRPLKPTRTSRAQGFSFEPPDIKSPLDSNVVAAVFDGGYTKNKVLLPWVEEIAVPGISESVEEYLSHGTQVTSALLFGPLRDGRVPTQPFGKVHNYRVLDASSKEDPYELFDVLKRIKKVVEKGHYQFINLSIGPDLPIEDHEVHAWTAVLDQLLANGDTLATIAVGNNGKNDVDSGNARIQTPSDCVNALAVGAADSVGSDWARAEYSAFGPGRSPGLIKPDLIAFGGSYHEPFYTLEDPDQGVAIATHGTSFASPTCLRMAMGVRAHFGSVMSPLALKALLIHTSRAHSNLPRAETGWGRAVSDIDDLVITGEGSVRVLYQGEIEAGQYLRVPIPLPAETIEGNVKVTATFSFCTSTDPEDPGNYTRSGLEVVFRPHNEKFKQKAKSSNPSPFFQLKEFSTEAEMRRDAHKWETTLHRSRNLRGTTLKDPVFDIHYNARESGRPTNTDAKIKYALAVTISAKKCPEIYNKVVQRFRTKLEVLKPQIQIPVLSQT